jgi:hypothetical protein
MQTSQGYIFLYFTTFRNQILQFYYETFFSALQLFKKNGVRQNFSNIPLYAILLFVFLFFVKVIFDCLVFVCFGCQEIYLTAIRRGIPSV